jgi:adenosylcobinamide-GDP ribazoletransferase
MITRFLSFPIIKAFFLSLSLLTRIPAPHLQNLQPEDSGRSALFYPLIGLVIGCLLCIPFFIFPAKASPFLLAAVITTFWVMVTGGLHLDGLADSADGWLGGQGDTEKTKLIMKDPLVGSAGVIAIVCIILLKFSALTTLIMDNHWTAILIAPMLGRSMILSLFLSTPYVRNQGMASSVIDYIPRKIAILVILLCFLIAMSFSLTGMLFALTGFFLLRYMMLSYLDGCTGDTAGATVEITEMFWLLGVALFL